LKTILGANIIVSALLSPQGPPAKILNLVLDKKLTLVYDNRIFAEYVDVLSREKFKFDKELVDLIIDYIAKEGEYARAEFQNIEFTDEGHKMFYELYKSGRVDYLITGNKTMY
jgi:putative PIN family toxin of toxin-antitoxin system